MATVDLTILQDFDPRLYGWGGMANQLTDRQHLQVEVARIYNTSVDDAKSSIGVASANALRHALALARKSERKGLITMISRELKKRGEQE